MKAFNHSVFLHLFLFMSDDELGFAFLDCFQYFMQSSSFIVFASLHWSNSYYFVLVLPNTARSITLISTNWISMFGRAPYYSSAKHYLISSVVSKLALTRWDSFWGFQLTQRRKTQMHAYCDNYQQKLTAGGSRTYPKITLYHVCLFTNILCLNPSLPLNFPGIQLFKYELYLVAYIK